MNNQPKIKEINNMKKPTAIDDICAIIAVMLIGVLFIVMCAG